MNQIVSLSEHRERRTAEEHARALVLFECATQLARKSHPALLQAIEDAFGPGWIDAKVRETVTPQRMVDAPQIVRAKRRPAR